MDPFEVEDSVKINAGNYYSKFLDKTLFFCVPVLTPFQIEQFIHQEFQVTLYLATSKFFFSPYNLGITSKNQCWTKFNRKYLQGRSISLRNPFAKLLKFNLKIFFFHEIYLNSIFNNKEDICKVNIFLL